MLQRIADHCWRGAHREDQVMELEENFHRLLVTVMAARHLL